VFATDQRDTGLFRVSAVADSPVVLTRPEKGTDHFRPWFLPGGRAVLFTIVPESISRRAESQVAVLDLGSATNTPKVLIRGGGDARYVSTGHLVNVADNSLRAVRFDLDRLEPVGTAVPVLASAHVIGGFLGDFDVSDNGTFVYLAETTGGVAERTLTWVDRQGKEEPLPAQPRAYLYPRISPDGTRVALDVRDQENDIWVWDLQRGNITRVTKDSGVDRMPVWAADGQFLFFSSTREGSPVIFRQRADGTGEAERLTQSSVAQHPVSLSADGTELLFQHGPGIQNNDLMALRVDSPGKAGGPNVRPVVKTADGEANGAFSPDGRWLAYQSNESGNWDIYVRPMRDLERGTRVTVSTGGGTQPRWARDGRELFYLSPQNEMMSVPVGSGDSWSAGKPVKLFDAAGYYTGGTGNPYFNYDVAKDGRFLMIKPKGDPAGEGAATTNLIVIQHWFEELKRLLP
jgi:serine/threonine-protein kinase